MNDISAAIRRLDKWKGTALAAVCAKSVSPVVVQFGQLRTQEAFEDGLLAVWESISDGAPTPNVALARPVLDNLSESSTDDSSVPAFDVMIAISVLAYALDAIIEDDWVGPTTNACNAAKSQYSGYDYVLTYGDETRIVDPQNLPPPGRLESFLIESQFLCLEELRRASGLPQDVLAKLRRIADNLAFELNQSVRTYAKRRAWLV